MTKKDFDEIVDFPVTLISKVRFMSEKTALEKGECFIAIGKKTIGKDDHSFIDEHGHLHYFENCVLQ